MIYDLHVHSTASDGTCSPTEVVDEAIARGLAGIALTDHDTMEGLKTAAEYIKDNQFSLEFIPGIEMNTELNENEVHILGYYVDADHLKVKRRLTEIRSQRKERAQKMIAKLSDLGVKISYEEVHRLAGSDLIARPHIARAMIAAGYVSSVKEAFDYYLGKEKPAYVKRYKFVPSEAIELIKQMGGIAVLAHPGLIRDQNLIPSIISLGIEGLEVYYPEHTPEQLAGFLQLAEQYGLLVTGGSDFHGNNITESRSQLGAAGIDSKLMSKIKAYRNTIYGNS
ncbi:PHP, C-terminal [Syntrophomonas zehnderi OL-4]|uniref:PHP, C-terminal n=1 Tax=Syntrophomonas zehnderi OL-4 TaxID=690567 RepID=A0A0E4GB66_9FIRM|nr:PHP domain-containing protein [Syntrophomonas zehnderi]CFX76504.1 PHP, C-terminal [Syntrophomonas zehnderi OL-4]